MNKVKPALFTATEITTDMNEKIGSTAILEAIARNHSILHDHFFSPFSEPDAYLELLESIRLNISSPVLQGQLEEDWYNEANKHDDSATRLLQHVRNACLYLELASIAEQNKNRDRAWAFNSHASLMVGEIIERSAAILNLHETEKRSVKNSVNAQGRNKAVLPLKKEVARLLEHLRPEAGWPHKSTAVAVLERHLSDFIDTNNISAVQISNIENWLPRWLLEDELVKRAWERTKRPKANNR